MNSVPYSYDANGNLTSDGAHSYTWDKRNRLTGSAGKTFSYNSAGSRYKAMDTSSGAAEYTYYMPLEELRGGTSTIAGTPTYYVFANGQRIASMELPSGTSAATAPLSYVHQDHLGGTSAVTDEDGNVLQLYEYYPYGEELRSEQLGAVDTPHSFTDKELDEDMGLYYFEARWYNPAIGRFSSQDPAQMDGRVSAAIADPQSLNFYSYARNNPIIITDPSGECFWDACFLETLGFTAAVEAIVGAATVVAGAIGLDVAVNNLTDRAIETLTTATINTVIDNLDTIVDATSTGSTHSGSRAYGDIRDWVIGAGRNPDATPSGYEWHGKGPTPADGPGAWVEPGTGASLHPDLDHEDPKGPHWDYIDENGNKISIDNDGNIIDNGGNVIDEYESE